MLRGVITPRVSLTAVSITNGISDPDGGKAEEDEETEDGAGIDCIVTLENVSVSLLQLRVLKPVRTTWAQEFRGICS
jgi:hypothetical protein